MSVAYTAEDFETAWKTDKASEEMVIAALRIAAAAVEWANARLATTDAPVADVRKDQTFREKLDRLAKAEERLSQLALTDG